MDKKNKSVFRNRADRALMIIGALFGLLLLVDLAVVVSARAESPAPATHHVKKKQKKAPKVVKGKPLGAVDLKRYQYCGSDDDCVKANNGCCDCANGGEDVSVARDRLNDFNLRFECQEAHCTKKAAVPECSSGVVSCVNHQCKYFTDADFHP